MLKIQFKLRVPRDSGPRFRIFSNRALLSLPFSYVAFKIIGIYFKQISDFMILETEVKVRFRSERGVKNKKKESLVTLVISNTDRQYNKIYPDLCQLFCDIYFNSDCWPGMVCLVVKPNISGLDCHREGILHNGRMICVSWKHLKIKQKKSDDMDLKE